MLNYRSYIDSLCRNFLRCILFTFCLKTYHVMALLPFLRR